MEPHETSTSLPPPEQPFSPALSSLEPDTFALVCGHLRHREVAALAATCASLRNAVNTNDRLWAGLFSHQFPQPWQRLTQLGQQQQQQGQQQQQQQQQAGGLSSDGGGVVPGAWRGEFLRTHTACQQLRSTHPACREWTTDSTPVHLAAIYGTGEQRLTLAAQGATVELRCAVPPSKSFQLYGHSARVSCAAVLRAGSGGSVRRLGVVTGSHDQTVRLWAANADPESYEFRAQSLSLLTPLRTLRGHQESVTCLHLVAGSTGVTIAATGGKDRTVRLWGLAPLVPSPVHKPQIATLRGHGAPVTCLASCGSGHGSGAGTCSWGREEDGDGGSASSASGSGWLMSGSLDARVKRWDPWTAACTGTAKCAAPVTALAPAAAAELAPHTLLVLAGGSCVQLLDVRSMRVVAGVSLPSELHCFSQWGWDLATGCSDGARVFDLRALTSSAGSPAGISPAGGGAALLAAAGRGATERLRLGERHSRPVTSIHVDRLKVVTGTDRYGEAPLCAWCTTSGERLAELGSCLPPVPSPLPALVPDGLDESAQGFGPGGGADEPAAQGAEEAAGEAAATAQGGQQAPGHQRQYRRSWDGVTALACRGALVVCGNSEGTVCERDYSHGGLPEAAGDGGSGRTGAGKFWQYC